MAVILHLSKRVEYDRPYLKPSHFSEIVPMKTVLVCLFWLSAPPMTIIVLDDSRTAVQPCRGGGRSPVMILTQELVRGGKTLMAGTAVLVLWPPTASRFPFRLAAVDLISGVSGRVFQTDVWLADWWVGEVAFWMRGVRETYRTVVIAMLSASNLPSR